MAKLKKGSLNNLHCGACLKSFNSIELLSKHLVCCPEAKLLLPLLHIVSFGGDKSGHPLAHFIWNIRKAIKQDLIKRYAYAVAGDLNIMERARLHKELCDCLEIKYEEFRPFESSQIIKIMNRKEALIYLCEAIRVISLQIK